MIRNGLAIAALAATMALAGCGKKTPDVLPPAPAEDGQTQTGEDPNAGNVSGVPLPGSRGDFLQNVPSDSVYFETESFSLDGQDRATLDSQIAWLQRYPNVRVTIEGHADERGTREYNLALGDRRANAAKNYLAGRGIPTSRMTVVSWGKERPVALGSDESAWSQNRRAVSVVPQ
ncbi:MAG: peptidoglycan-associated lipoprotein Pal [Sphingosinicella sp.]|nr:peptidoglycan-associated lipoprotein Pal [Sphingosinicella sp.]